MKNKIILIVKDGFGYRKSNYFNAVNNADLPNHKKYIKNYPTTLLHTSGEYVGLPPNNIGSSEVGHLILGAGRVVLQSLVRIDREIQDGYFFENEALQKGLEHIKKYKGNIHLMGLFQTEGVHSYLNHLKALLQFFQKNKIENKKIFIHAFSDGRDNPPRSIKTYIDDMQQHIEKTKYGKIVSLSGRYYAMDRDNRFDRIKLAYNNLISDNHYRKFESIYDIIDNSYKNNLTDEFILPQITKDFQGIKDNDLIVFFNYRADRARQLSQAFIDTNFVHFKAKTFKNLHFIGMTNYYNEMQDMENVNIIYPKIHLENILSEYLSHKDLTQLKIAETEKYAHVTYFFNGQSHKNILNETKILIPSPKVADYSKTPEMSAYKITYKALQEIITHKYDFVLINYANPDILGHTGNYKQTIKANEIVDECIDEIVENTLKMGYTIIITSDHGNSEIMKDEKIGMPHTAHTTNPVYLSIVSDDKDLQKIKLKKDCTLANVAPTILNIMGLKIPEEMTDSLF